MKTVRLLAATLLASVCHSTLAADFEAQIGWHRWSSGLSGDLNTSNLQIDQIDLEQDLGFEKEGSRHFYVHLEHPLPAAPNIKLQHTVLNKQQETNLTKTISYNNINFSANEKISSDVDLTHSDLTVYWQPLQHKYLTVGAGMTVRFLDGSVEVASLDNQNSTRHLIDKPIPAAYLLLRSNLPFSDLRIMAEANALAFDGDSLLDATVKLSYTPVFGLGIELGWRYIEISLDNINVRNTTTGQNDKLNANVRIDGAFAGVLYRF